eukprot:COSAG01_NODE_5519_length_4206_cov_8.464703_2_plen_189_part_00
MAQVYDALYSQAGWGDVRAPPRRTVPMRTVSADQHEQRSTKVEDGGGDAAIAAAPGKVVVTASHAVTQAQLAASRGNPPPKPRLRAFNKTVAPRPAAAPQWVPKRVAWTLDLCDLGGLAAAGGTSEGSDKQVAASAAAAMRQNVRAAARRFERVGAVVEEATPGSGCLEALPGVLLRAHALRCASEVR